MKSNVLQAAGLATAIAASVACGRSASASAAVSVELAGPILAEPLIARLPPREDGSLCIGGWMVHAKLRIRETAGVDVQLKNVVYTFLDASTGYVLTTSVRAPGSWWFDDPSVIPAEGEVTLDLGALRFLEDMGARRPPGPGPVDLRGAVNAVQPDGSPLMAPFLFTAVANVKTSPWPTCEYLQPTGAP